jgi:hypothetical protein
MENFVAVVNGDVNEAFARDPISWHQGAVTVPTSEPHWDYNTPGGMQKKGPNLVGHPL